MSEPLKLFLISQGQYTGYDTYDSLVVAALNEDVAKKIHPDESNLWDEEKQKWVWHDDKGVGHDRISCDTWSDHIKHVDCELIGLAEPGTKPGVIVSSFNAG